MEKKIISNVRNHDFHVMAIREEDDTPQFFYTIGLYSQYQHPELLIMGLNVDVAYDILSRAHGRRFPPSLTIWRELLMKSTSCATGG
jgi:hypothetical protein